MSKKTNLFKHAIQDLLEKAEQAKLIRSVEKRIGYRFRNKNLLLNSLVHRSVVTGKRNEAVENNERLEFLGDSVLNMIVTHYLYQNFPGENEGDLSKKKAIIVSTQALAACSRELKLGEFLVLGTSEEKSGGRDRTSTLADLFEAILGAMYLDRGSKPCEKLVSTVLLPKAEGFVSSTALQNYKSLLLEWAQENKLPQPTYQVVKETGPQHERIFEIEVFCGEKSMGLGKGSSKKIAQQEAARLAMEGVENP